jgi:hypothetical protein
VKKPHGLLVVSLALSLVALTMARPGATALAEDRPALFSLQVAPVMDIPLGTSLDLYRFVGGAAIGAELRMPFLSALSVDAGFGYTFYGIRNAPSAEQSLSMLSLNLGLGYQFPILRTLGVKIYAAGGYAYGFSNDVTQPQTGGGTFLEAGARLAWFLVPEFGLGFGLGYRYEFGLFQGLVASVGAVVRFTGGPGEILHLQDVQFGNIFPVFHKYYDDHPVGTAVIANESDYTATDVALSIQIKPFMTAPKQCATVARLAPGESSPVDLYALFAEEQILAVTEGTKASAEIGWKYTVNGKQKTGSLVETVRILARNNVTWEDDRMAAAFVTALDPQVNTFSRNVLAVARSTTTRALDSRLPTAIALYAGLCQYGMKYVVDPQSSYAQQSVDRTSLDTVLFPQQTLEYKGGDCDDLSVLYCALFESVGVPTAFITVPGHIYMAFSLKMSAAEAQRSFQRPDDIICIGDTAWLPIEVTSLDGKFLEAWQEGAKEWREASDRGEAALYPLQEAWALYEPVGLIGGTFRVTPPTEQVVAAAYKRELQRVVEAEIAGELSRLEAAIRKSPTDVTLMNRLGVLYAKYDLLDKAEQQFTAAVSRQEFAPALMNLGNIAYLRNDLTKAASFYERAYEREPDDAKAIACLARCYWEAENYAPIPALYDKLVELDPELAGRFAFLGQGEGTTVRASDVAAAREEVLWGGE